MALPQLDATQIAAAVPLDIELEPYRERLTPLAMAVLQGASRREIERRRDVVAADVWDDRLHASTKRGLGVLRAELQRKLSMLDLAVEDIQRGARRSALIGSLVDRVLAELLDHNDENLRALEELNGELDSLPAQERPWRAAFAARGAASVTGIPPNEIRAAVTRAAVAAQRGAAAAAALVIARGLATPTRRAAARDWVRALADGSREHVPALAAELLALAASPLPADPADDPIWVQACIGLTLELGLRSS